MNRRTRNVNRELKRKQNNIDQFREDFIDLYSHVVANDNPLQRIDAFFKENQESLNTLLLVDASQRPIPKSRSNGSNVSFLPILTVLFPILKENVRREVATLFVKYDGDLNRVNYKGDRSALYEAVLLGDKRLIKKLMELHADLGVLKGYQQEVFYEVTELPRPKGKTRKIPKNVSRKKASPKQPSPKQASPKQPSPKQPSPKQASPQRAERQPSPKQASPKQASPKQPSPKQASPQRAERQPSPKQASPKQASPQRAERPQLRYDIPVTPYVDEEPEFWKPLFQEGEMKQLRERLRLMMRTDCDLGQRGWKEEWTLCNTIKRFLPTYFVPKTSKPYFTPAGMAIGEKPIDFSNFNVILCAAFLVVGIVGHKMKDQEYQFLLKGGKAIQLVLAETEQMPYESEDIDLLILPKKAYDREEIKQVAGHLASLMKWFVEMPNLPIALQTPDMPDANPDLYKLSYPISTGRAFKAFSDIDFKELPKEMKKYYRHLTDFTQFIPELETEIAFDCPILESLLDEKVFYYAKFEQFSHLENILEPGYEKTTREDCLRFMDKFKRAILALNRALQKQEHPLELREKEVDSIRSRLNKLPDLKRDPLARDRILRSLYP